MNYSITTVNDLLKTHNFMIPKAVPKIFLADGAGLSLSAGRRDGCFRVKGAFRFQVSHD
jgi:hypothetical protein